MKNLTLPHTGIAAAAAAICLMSASPALAADITFSYGQPGEQYKVYGFDKKEAYDVAIRIADASYAGAKVKGFEVPLPVEATSVENLTGWMSSELKLENKVNVPDIAVKEATLEDWVLKVTFDEPYEIPAEGVYVGYSFNVTELGDYSSYPVAVFSGTDPDGLYLHTSRTRLKWKSVVETTGAVSAMTVYLETQTGDYAMTPVLPALSHAGLEEGVLKATFVNKGAVDATSVGFTCTIGETAISETYTLPEPVKGGGGRSEVEIPLGKMPEPGVYPVRLTVETINGQPNGDKVDTAEGELEVLPFIPVTRPLVEEFTGLGCAFCPRGYVAMEEMNEALGDMFVGMAYHAQAYEAGGMVTLPNSEFPVDVSGYPNGTINRDQMLDPAYFQEKWPVYQAEFSPASVDVSLEWAGSEGKDFDARVKVRFARPFTDGDYRISVALVADGLSNPKWRQSNAYSGESSEIYTGKWWDLFTQAGRTVTGLTFNDVVAYYRDVRGVEGSVPASMEAGDEAVYECRISKADILNIDGDEFINEEATIHAVGILLDATTGKVVNCNKSASLDYTYTGIDEVKTADVVSTTYYDLQGLRVADPRQGIFIKVDTLSDGTTARSKVRL